MKAQPCHKKQVVIGVVESVVLLSSSLPPQFEGWKGRICLAVVDQCIGLYGGRVHGFRDVPPGF
jgi:hypothetical protein